jgi:hypothetical protein
MLRVVLHESGSVRMPDRQSEIQDERQEERGREVEERDYRHDAAVFAAIQMASASTYQHTTHMLTLYQRLELGVGGLSFQPESEGDPAVAQCGTSPPCIVEFLGHFSETADRYARGRVRQSKRQEQGRVASHHVIHRIYFLPMSRRRLQ